jgi:hypothetical protein
MKKTITAWDLSVSAGENAQRILPPLAREFFATGRIANGPGSTPLQLHAFRLSAKRFRYTLELFEPMYGPMLAKRLDQVRKIQSLLGDRQDCVVLAERLKQRAAESERIGKVLAKVNADGRAFEEKFRRYWRETFDAEGAEALWIRYLERRPTETGAPLPPVRIIAATKRATKRTEPHHRRG